MWMKLGAVYQKNAGGQDFLYAIMRRRQAIMSQELNN